MRRLRLRCFSGTRRLRACSCVLVLAQFTLYWKQHAQAHETKGLASATDYMKAPQLPSSQLKPMQAPEALEFCLRQGRGVRLPSVRAGKSSRKRRSPKMLAELLVKVWYKGGTRVVQEQCLGIANASHSCGGLGSPASSVPGWRPSSSSESNL